MAQIIGLPKLSPTMEEGVLVRWVKKEGDKVQPGDLVAEVETDKANMDFNLEDEGVLIKLLVKEGDTVKLGAPVAILGDEGEDVSDLLRQAQAGGSAGKAAATAPPIAAIRPETAPRAPTATAASKPEVKRETKARTDGKAAAPQPPAEANRRLLASPLAKTLAIELGIDLRRVRGTGPGGRIVERDVRAAAETGGERERPDTGAAGDEPDVLDAMPEDDSDIGESSSGRALAVITPGPLSLPGQSDEYVNKPLTPVRRTIAQRLSQAKREIPHYRLTATIDAAPLGDFRQRLNRLLGDRGKVSFNDLLIKGAALALRRVPECNASFAGDAIRYYTRVHIGVAVALEQGLLTPVIRNADLKGIGVISGEVRDLVDRAKRKQIKSHEIQGATFTLSNLGMFGIDQFDAIINPPAACILAIGRIQKVPVVNTDGESITIGDRLTLTMSCDHRVVDGALGARYMDELRDLLERPESLAL